MMQAATGTLWGYSVLKHDIPELFEVLSARILELLPHENITGQVALTSSSLMIIFLVCNRQIYSQL